MNSTKQKILVASLKLFNECGVTNVSLRDIANELGISVGNLQYHFKKREEIIEGLYFQLVENLDKLFSISPIPSLKSFFDISTNMIRILYDYHFFLLDFITITRGNPEIKNHYSALSKRREEESLQMVDILIQCGLFRKRNLKNEYRNLYKRIELLSNFWFSSILIQEDKLSKTSIDEYTLLISQNIYPYLTNEGKKQYSTIYPNQSL